MTTPRRRSPGNRPRPAFEAALERTIRTFLRASASRSLALWTRSGEILSWGQLRGVFRLAPEEPSPGASPASARVALGKGTVDLVLSFGRRALVIPPSALSSEILIATFAVPEAGNAALLNTWEARVAVVAAEGRNLVALMKVPGVMLCDDPLHLRAVAATLTDSVRPPAHAAEGATRVRGTTPVGRSKVPRGGPGGTWVPPKSVDFYGGTHVSPQFRGSHSPTTDSRGSSPSDAARSPLSSLIRFAPTGLFPELDPPARIRAAAHLQTLLEVGRQRCPGATFPALTPDAPVSADGLSHALVLVVDALLGDPALTPRQYLRVAVRADRLLRDVLPPSFESPVFALFGQRSLTRGWQKTAWLLLLRSLRPRLGKGLLATRDGYALSTLDALATLAQVAGQDRLAGTFRQWVLRESDARMLPPDTPVFTGTRPETPHVPPAPGPHPPHSARKKGIRPSRPSR